MDYVQESILGASAERLDSYLGRNKGKYRRILFPLSCSNSKDDLTVSCDTTYNQPHYKLPVAHFHLITLSPKPLSTEPLFVTHPTKGWVGSKSHKDPSVFL